jgi:hypothetical protein
MATKKTTGKKLADMMYGNPEGAAFGIYPKAGKRSEDKQDREAAKNFPVDLARGVVAGAAGMPGDIESLIRMLPGLNEQTVLPTSEDVLRRIPFGSDSPTGRFASGLGTLAGGSAPFGAIPRAVKAAPGALKTAARNLSTPRTMNPQAGSVRIGDAKDVLPAAEREANKAKFLEPSKVKDRMYHATNADFNSFRRNHRGAQFVTPDRDFANQHIGDDAFTGAVENFEEGANIMPVHVQVKKPFDYENLQDVKNLFRQAQKDRIPLDRDWKQGILEGNWDSLENEKIMRSIQNLGYDAMFVSERDYTGEPIKNLGIFDPRKIKSETGNRGTYDIEDPDITKAEGGAVHFSDNPDVMQLELAAGGLVKGIKAAAKAAKEPAQAPMKASEALGRIEGRPLVITQSDRTKVGGGFLGGPGFSGLQLTEPEYRAAEAVWGVKTPGAAKMILGGGKKAGPDPVYTTFIGTPNQHQSNQMVFDKLLGDFRKSARKGGLDPELQEKINYRLANAVDKEGRPIFPPDVNILDKNFRELATTFDQRAVTSSLIGGLGVGGKKGQIVDYDKIIRNTTDPALLDVPTGALGNRLFTLSGGIIDRPDLHPAFPTILQGEDLGVSFEPVVRDLVMKDYIERTMREKGRPPGYMDYTRGHPPSQLITEDILTEMQKLGKKAGGAVRKAAGGEITADDLILEERKL